MSSVSAVVPLKDITDVAGDAADGCQNWLALLGRRRLLAASALALGAAVAVALLGVPSPLRWALVALGGSTLALVVAAQFASRLWARLYRTILLLVVLQGAALIALWYLRFP